MPRVTRDIRPRQSAVGSVIFRKLLGAILTHSTLQGDGISTGPESTGIRQSTDIAIVPRSKYVFLLDLLSRLLTVLRYGDRAIFADRLQSGAFTETEWMADHVLELLCDAKPSTTSDYSDKRSLHFSLLMKAVSAESQRLVRRLLNMKNVFSCGSDPAADSDWCFPGSGDNAPLWTLLQLVLPADGAPLRTGSAQEHIALELLASPRLSKIENGVPCSSSIPILESESGAHVIHWTPLMQAIGLVSDNKHCHSFLGACREKVSRRDSPAIVSTASFKVASAILQHPLMSKEILNWHVLDSQAKCILFGGQYSAYFLALNHVIKEF